MKARPRTEGKVTATTAIVSRYSALAPQAGCLQASIIALKAEVQ